MSDRYARMFRRLDADGAIAFTPFVTLGDPNPSLSDRILEALADAGADAVELGLPFSDPVADGQVIQQAATRALAAGTTIDRCWDLVAALRARHLTLPIGLLGYANLALARGLDRFYAEARAAGVDSILLADVPVAEAEPFVQAARRHRVAPVLIVPPEASESTTRRIARLTDGYTYLTTRAGVTGESPLAQGDLARRIALVAEAGGPPAMLGFGISSPAQVRAAARIGAAGAISGSAVVRRIARHLDDDERVLEAVRGFVTEMAKAARGIASRDRSGKT